MNQKPLYEEWLEAQESKTKGQRAFKKNFIGERGYPHLDGKLHFPKLGRPAEQAAWLKEVVEQESKLAQHGFLPFIRKDQRQRKFRQPPYDYSYSSLRGERDQKKFSHIKSRPIMYASHRDACIFSYYSYTLQLLYENRLAESNLGNNVIAYRSISGKNNVDFAKEAFTEMQSRDEYDCMMVDVKSFFDTIDHILLKKRWSDLIRGGFAASQDHEIIYNRITKYRYIIFSEAIQTLRTKRRSYLIKEQGCLKLCRQSDYNHYLKQSVRTNRSGKGIPQGSPISGVLANLYLLDFDQTMRDVVVEKYGGVYQRYSDDIFIICPLGKAIEIYDQLKQALSNDKLVLGLHKTEAFRMEPDSKLLKNVTQELEPAGNNKREETQYLGFHFNGEKIGFRSSTLSKHLRGNRKADYLRGAYKKTNSARVGRQLNKIRRTAKSKL